MTSSARANKTGQRTASPMLATTRWVRTPEDSPASHKGEWTAHRLQDCATYPGVAHDYWLYVPEQYVSSRPSSLMVFLDGWRFLDEKVAVPIVLDNLLHKQEIPIMAALFINAGDKGPGLPLWGGSSNRSVEYDSTDDRFATFLLSELLPAVRQRVNIGCDANARGIAGIRLEAPRPSRLRGIARISSGRSSVS